MNKETLLNIPKKIVSPGIVAGISLATGIGGGTDMIIGLETMSNTEEGRHPSISSPIEIKQAREQILVFDKEVRNLIVAGKSPVDIVEISTADNISRVTRSIELVSQEEEILQQRQELHEQLLHKRSWRSYIDGGLMLGGILLTLISDSMYARRLQQSILRKRQK